jgi:hypothetical protein
MPNRSAEFRVSVVDDEIIVTWPGSFYSVTYFKPEKSPQLLAKRLSNHDDLRFLMTAAEFLAEAWRLANARARELGWIAVTAPIQT